MQEEGLKKGKKRIRQKREHADAAVWRERIRWIGVEILWGCGAWILGQAPLAFGTYPLGLALLCGSSRHTLAILIGLICTAVSNMQDPLIYVFTYLAAAFVRVFASKCYPPVYGRLPTRYSPVRH